MTGDNTAATRRWLIVNADDFGASSGINRGIVDAHRRGPVTSASLMVNMPGTIQAAELVADVPALSVGIHVNFTNEGEPVVPLDDPSACRDELRRQVERFLALTGRPPTHVDSHHNVHLRFEALGELFAATAAELDVPLRDRSGIPYVPEFYGRWDDEMHPEQVTPGSFLRIAEQRLTAGDIVELACHPGFVDPSFESEYHAERELERRALCDPVTAEGIRRAGITLVGFADLATVGLR